MTDVGIVTKEVAQQLLERVKAGERPTVYWWRDDNLKSAILDDQSFLDEFGSIKYALHNRTRVGLSIGHNPFIHPWFAKLHKTRPR